MAIHFVSTAFAAGTTLKSTDKYSEAIDISSCNNIVAQISYTKGDETNTIYTFQTSLDGTIWSNAEDKVPGNPTEFYPIIATLTASGTKRIPIPIGDYYLRCAAKATAGTPTGTFGIKLALNRL